MRGIERTRQSENAVPTRVCEMGVFEMEERDQNDLPEGTQQRARPRKVMGGRTARIADRRELVWMSATKTLIEGSRAKGSQYSGVHKERIKIIVEEPTKIIVEEKLQSGGRRDEDAAGMRTRRAIRAEEELPRRPVCASIAGQNRFGRCVRGLMLNTTHMLTRGWHCNSLCYSL